MEDWQRFHIQIIRISEEKNDRTKLIFKTIIQENFLEEKILQECVPVKSDLRDSQL